MPLYAKTHFFGHNLMRKYIAAFGALFNDLEVVRFKSNGEEDHRVRVPLAYGPKEKWYVRNSQDPELKDSIQILWPRMSFETTGFVFSSERQQPNNLKIKYSDPNDPNGGVYVFTPVPYNIIFNLYIGAKSVDEVHQVIEQILPQFSADVTLRLKLVPSLNIVADCPIVINSVDMQDLYDGSFSESRNLSATLTFELKGWFYGPVNKNQIIKTTITNVYSDQVPETPQLLSTVQSQPFNETIPLDELSMLDEWGYLHTINSPADPSPSV